MVELPLTQRLAIASSRLATLIGTSSSEGKTLAIDKLKN
jgi:hypothetical protein